MQTPFKRVNAYTLRGESYFYRVNHPEKGILLKGCFTFLKEWFTLKKGVSPLRVFAFTL